MDKLVVFSGAGLSSESGIRTFRGVSGMWNDARIDDVCNEYTWKQNFNMVHEFYNSLRVELGGVHPNVAHLKIAEWQRQYDTVIITQNVDDLLERAGCHDVIHLHGYLTDMHCASCGTKWSMGYAAWNPSDRCRNSKSCAGWVKPSVVFFNEYAPNYQKLNQTLGDLTADDVIVVIGTSGTVVPVHSYLKGCPGYKILNNLEAERNGLNAKTNMFDLTLFKPATEGIHDIDNILATRLDRK